MGTFDRILKKIEAHREAAQRESTDIMLERNGIREIDLDGEDWKIEHSKDTRPDGSEMIVTRLYKMVDYRAVTIESLVRTTVKEEHGS